MDNISSLVHDLRERIAASASDAASSSNSHPVETEFRVVLPILLDAYVVPSSTGNERDFNTVLKLLSHTARNYPGVFFHGRAAALLPVIGRLFPFLAHPAFSSHHGDICETIVSLLSLLRTGEPEVYRQFVLDAMVVVRDVLHISSTLSLKCFSESFSFILNCSETFSELPVCCRPLDGPGVLIIIDNKKRWQPFAAWTIRLINNCLMGGTFHVEELIDDNFAYSVCSYLLCYGDATLHMACFEFARLTTTVIPLKKFIRSIASILCREENKFRNIEYDSCMGACLHLLHSSCSDEIVKSTANEIMTAFPKFICSTESYELQAKDSSLLASVLLIYLQAVHSILCLQDLESREKLFQDDEFLTDVERSSCVYPKYIDLLELLKLPWTCNSIIQQACQVGKIKCLCVQVFSKIGPKLKDESDLEVLDLAIHDEDEEVCFEAVTSMPVIVLCSGQIFFEKMLRKLESVGRNISPQIRRSILFSVGYMAYLYGSSNSHGGQDSPCSCF